ncbi:hypothetical protein [Mycobacterium ostraviense]
MAYRNERETGRAVANSGVPRDQLYVVTELANPDQVAFVVGPSDW